MPVNNLQDVVAIQCDVLNKLPLPQIRALANKIDAVSSAGRTVWICGNGGSATTAAHLATDLSKGVFVNRNRQYRSICINEQLGPMSAWSNDVSFEQSLFNYLSSVCVDGDLLILITGSGNSRNLIEALGITSVKNVETVGLTGMGGGKIAPLLDLNIQVDSDNMQIVENTHLIIVHLLYDLLSGNTF